MTITIIDGKLGFISPYRVLDTNTSQKLAEANLAVFREQLRNYRGMQGDCNQKLGWSLEQYAKFHEMLPQLPELVKVQDTNLGGLWGGLIAVVIGIAGVYWTAPWVTSYVGILYHGSVYDMDTFADRWFQNLIPRDVFDTGAAQYILRGHYHSGFWRGGLYPDPAWFWWLMFIPFAVAILVGLTHILSYWRVIVANGEKPRENARRMKEYEKNMAAAFKKAKSAKETTDFQLNDQIRELEGHIRTVDMHEADVLRFLEIFKS